MRKIATLAAVVFSIFHLPAQADGVKAPVSLGSQAKKVAAQDLDIEIRVEGGGWSGANSEEITALLHAVAAELVQHFPERQLAPIVVRHSNRAPVVLYDKGPNGEYLVYLCAHGKDWYQYVYEFAHELAHILSNYERHAHSQDARQHQWFEETLCEVASLYALKRVGMKWDNSLPYAHWGMDPEAFRKYAEHFLNEPHRKLPSEMTLASWFDTNRDRLTGNAYVRQHNEVVANLLLPLFEENPEIWEAIDYLNTAPASQSFEDYLQAWHDSAPACYQHVIRYTMHLFGIELGDKRAQDGKA
jgi:hypothetical protein